jgi:hypothetical protein
MLKIQVNLPETPRPNKCLKWLWALYEVFCYLGANKKPTGVGPVGF